MKSIVGLLLVAIAGCGGSGGQTVGTPGMSVMLHLAGFDGTKVSQLNMCFQRIRFKEPAETTNADVTTDPDNIDISGLGNKLIPSSGTALISLSLTAATYGRVEIDLENNCFSHALSFDNLNGGPFRTTDRVTLIFTGTFVLDVAGEFLHLDLDNIISELEDVAADSEVQSAAQAIQGTF